MYPCSGSERTLYQNFLALPILVVLLNTVFEKSSVFEAANAPLSAYIAVLLTYFAGVALSFTGMSLRTDISATLFTILGIVCKMASTLLKRQCPCVSTTELSGPAITQVDKIAVN